MVELGSVTSCGSGLEDKWSALRGADYKQPAVAKCSTAATTAAPNAASAAAATTKHRTAAATAATTATARV